MDTMARTETYEIVQGTRANPGKILRTFSSSETYKCGGPATACLRAWESIAYTGGRRNSVAVFFRKAA